MKTKRFRLRPCRHGTERGQRAVVVWHEHDADCSGHIVLAIDDEIVDLTPMECAALEGALAESRRYAR